MRRAILIIGWLISLIIATIFGAGIADKGQKIISSNLLEETQAMLAYNHMNRYREIESDLSKGCNAEALQKTNFFKEMQLDLIANFIKKHPGPAFSEYINSREPDLIKSLKNHKSVYGGKGDWPKCSK